MSRKPPAAPGGLVIVDKPSGMTSHDVVSRVRRMVKTRRVGHAGTLDPMATGVLVIGVERATKLLNYLPLDSKVYHATIRLGAATDTDDADGLTLSTGDPSALELPQILEAVAALTGDILQRPASVSALKIDGERAHALVRAGTEVILQPRPVTISRFEVTSPLRRPDGYLDFEVEVHCSAGTYIRALARDLGQALGCGGHLAALRRVAVGPFSVTGALSLEELAQRPEPIMLTLPQAIAAAMPVRQLSAEQARELTFGRTIEPAGIVGVHGGFTDQGRAVSLLAESAGRSRPVLGFMPAGSGAADVLADAAILAQAPG